jgi:hypothetical protein
MKQGSRVSIIIVQVGAVKIYAAAVDAAQEGGKRKERQDETQFTDKK